MRLASYCLMTLALVGCAESTTESPATLDGGGVADALPAEGPDAEVTDSDSPDAELPDAEGPDAEGPDAERPDAEAPCARGTPCNPIAIDAFPFVDEGDTTLVTTSLIDRYACAPMTDESGPEVYYALEIPIEGVLTVTVDDVSGDDVDVDVHLLEGFDATRCLARDNRTLQRWMSPGSYVVVVDTWVTAEGTPRPGPYRLEVDLRPVPMGGVCAVEPQAVEMFWRDCAPGLDCVIDEAGVVRLNTPTVGPVVKEAHLVTVDEGFPEGWPEAARDGLARHYQISEAATGYVMDRREPWAPEGEGGSRWGQAAYSRPLPVVDEAFYINMYWRRRPAPGTRMVVMSPHNGRAVIAAAGYETGPGANTAIAGVSEEIHHHLGTSHRDDLWIGFAVDQGLPLGPIECQ